MYSTSGSLSSSMRSSWFLKKRTKNIFVWVSSMGTRIWVELACRKMLGKISGCSSLWPLA